ncbi:MAG: hypothetical protein ACJA0Z_003742 [Halioglobus sp.]|jgi:hypothetical protein
MCVGVPMASASLPASVGPKEESLKALASY